MKFYKQKLDFINDTQFINGAGKNEKCSHFHFSLFIQYFG